MKQKQTKAPPPNNLQKSIHKAEMVIVKVGSGRAGPHLSKTFLSSPHRCVNDLEEELASPGVEDENSSIDGLCGQVTFKGLLR